MLNFGREVTLPVDLLLDPPPEDGDPSNLPPAVTQLQDRLREVSSAAREHLTSSMISQKRQFDKNVRLVQYGEGDLVWLHCPAMKRGRSAKLARLWKGPFLITHKINEVNYRIQASPRSRTQIVHADRLKPCLGMTKVDLGFGVGDEEPLPVQEPETPVDLEEDHQTVSSDTESVEEPGPPAPPSPVRTRRGRLVRAPHKPGFMYY